MAEITSQDVAKLRVDLSADIQKAMIALGWNQSKLAEKYGRVRRKEPYTRARISQIVKCNVGQEKPAEDLLSWLNKQVENNCL